MKFRKPVAELAPNHPSFDTIPLVKPTGFREYDARWWFGYSKNDRPAEINLKGIEAVGLGLGTFIHELGVGPKIVTGHDSRSYSLAIKHALIKGLVAAGAQVKDIGLALSPTAYYAQFALDCPSVAMVTASHNDNGWTGVKMGANPPLTFGADEMNCLSNIVLNGQWKFRDGGSCELIDGFADRYIADLTNRSSFTRKIKAVVACGNGTAGVFAPQVLETLGVEVVPMDTELDHSFPNYNPDPENPKMLSAMAERVKQSGADIALGFDGDGDRCGVVDNEGKEIFADKIGVLLARDIATTHENKQFVVDIKSTELFRTDSVLRELGAETDYYKSGHSHMKRRVKELNAIAGFEKSGHFFFNHPIGRGYDDGIFTAIVICDLLDRNPNSSMADLNRTLPRVFSYPTQSLFCADENKYQVIKNIVEHFKKLKQKNTKFSGQKITKLNLVNGIRVTLEDGTWVLVRASSNEPKLVIAVESPISENSQIKALQEMLSTAKQFLVLVS